MKTKPSIVTVIAIGAFALLTASCGKKTVTTAEKIVITDGSLTINEVAATADTYPLTTCVVSGEKLGEMGEPYVHVHEGTTVKFCCKACLKDFNEDPAKYIAMIK